MIICNKQNNKYNANKLTNIYWGKKRKRPKKKKRKKEGTNKDREERGEMKEKEAKKKTHSVNEHNRAERSWER